MALTDGTVAVFDAYFAGNPDTATPNRIIEIDGGSNLHGIVHDAVNDVLLLSDVGAATSAADPVSAVDGLLYVVNNASTANGITVPDISIEGPLTNLGNPVDVAYDGTNLYVAEKSNGVVQRWDNIRTSPGGNIGPTTSVNLTAPESVSLVTGL